MRNLNSLINYIIPYPSDRERRDGFNNTAIIDSLSEDEQAQVEILLLEMLHTRPDDMLIVETLGYMKSKKALVRLNKLLEERERQTEKIIIAISVYQIEPGEHLIDTALHAGQQIKSKWEFISIVNCLAKFKNERIDAFIKGYFEHPDYLVSYSAKKSLEKGSNP